MLRIIVIFLSAHLLRAHPSFFVCFVVLSKEKGVCSCIWRGGGRGGAFVVAVLELDASSAGFFLCFES